MAKPNITQVTTTQTFQAWLDKTNDIVDLLKTDVMTASALGDSTTGNATLVGNFTANNLIAEVSLQTNTISPRAGFTKISHTAPIEVNGSGNIVQTIVSPVGPRMRYSTGTVSWRTGFQDTADNNFIIDTGTGQSKLELTPTGDLTIAGKFIPLGGIELPSGTSITGNLIGDVTGDLTGDVTGDVTGNVIGNLTGNVTGNVLGDFTGDIYSDNGVLVFQNGANGTDAFVTGHISSISNHDTSDLAEDPNATPTSKTMYFTDQRAIDAINNAPQGSITSIVGIKAFIAFNGANGSSISSAGLTITKVGSGNYAVTFNSGFAPPDANYAVVLGNVDEGTTSRAVTNPASQPLTNYNTFVQSRTAAGFTIRATRNTTGIANYGDDNSNGFGIAAIDPGYVTASVLF